MANRVWAHFRPASEPLTPRITRQCSKKKRDRKSTRLNSSHLVISYAVFCFKKSTRLNSSHLVISYAVFCLKKKKKPVPPDNQTVYARCLPNRHEHPIDVTHAETVTHITTTA